MPQEPVHDFPLSQHIRIDDEPMSITEYREAGGYRTLENTLKNLHTPEIIDMVLESNLRGRGGAGFQTGKKWSLSPRGDNTPFQKYFVVNADEMEPGTFKDRWLMEGNPHQLLEGIILSSFTLEVQTAFIFLRANYTKAEKRLKKAIAEAYDEGILGKNILGTSFSLNCYLHASAGRYMCGEETALLNSLQGRRATPRTKPPFTVNCGLFGKPTVTNNVETVCNIPHIIENGAAWFRSLSRSKDGGTKIYGVSGKVKNPGLWELPMGTTIREIFEDYAGGMSEGLELRGIIPGGASTAFLTPDYLDTVMDFDSVPKAGSRMGTGTMIILDDQTCPVGCVLQLERFFARESCGWCTPCREGLRWVEKLLERIEYGQGTLRDLDILEEQTRLMGPGNTFCSLAPGAMEPLQSALKIFSEDFKRHIIEKRCPWRTS